MYLKKQEKQNSGLYKILKEKSHGEVDIDSKKVDILLKRIP
jgi:hypothetical protein